MAKSAAIKRTATLEHWPLERCIPYARNARVISDSAVGKVAASIKEFGFKQPIVVDAEGVIVVGHARLLAAERLGLETVPVLVADDLTPAQVKAYRLADNRTAQEATWDMELLGIELEDLAGMDIDLSLTGFDADELLDLKGDAGDGPEETQPVPEPPEEPVSKLGDIWLLGDHRLMCGDSTDAAAVTLLMNGERAGLMATDPPCLVDYHGGDHPAAHVNPKTGLRDKDWEHILAAKDKQWDDYVDQETSVAFYVNFLKVAVEHALIEHVPIYQWFASQRADIILAAWREVGVLTHQILIWNKGHGILTHCHYLYDYEPFMYGWPAGKKPVSKPPSTARAIWDVAPREGNEEGATRDHPTIKPVELQRRCIEYHTKRGGLLYEPFSGSGTAIVAAEQTHRRCYAMELSPAFVDVAVTRWQNLTGKKATLAP